MRALSWDEHGWEDYLYWQKTDKNVLKRINLLIHSAMRNPFEGIGKPEFLKGNLSGCMSRRIDEEHRLVYKVYDERIHVLACRFHYD